MKNVFDTPMNYLSEIKNIRIPISRRKKYKGKTILCVWLTKLCPAKCEHCFFKSNMYREGAPSEKYQFSDLGLDKVIKFINDSNNSYLMLSGGGEPMVKRSAVMEIVRKAKTERIVIVTSGLWATSYKKAQEIIAELYDSFKSRQDNAILVLRLSIDQFHYKPLGFNILDNIIRVYREQFQNIPNFELRIHTIMGDPTLQEVANRIGDCEIVDTNVEMVSDNQEVIKIVPKQAFLAFKDGYRIHVGRSKLFLSNLKMDLNTMTPDVRSALDVFEEDMSASEYGNPSILTNTNGSLGLDFWMDYNGNVTTWGNQQWDELYNVYVDDYQKLVDGTFNNVVSYSFLEKGFYYRERIFRTVNPKAVLRSMALNLRDYAGAFLVEEDKTKLYYAIRVVKDYIEEGTLEHEDINFLSPELKKLIDSEVKAIDHHYHQSKYDILAQFMENESTNKDEWDDMLLLIKLGHYTINEDNLKKCFEKYNSLFECDLSDIQDISDTNDEIQYGRLHDRISFMKPEARDFCLNLHQISDKQ